MKILFLAGTRGIWRSWAEDLISWKHHYSESCVSMAAGCYFERPSLLFHIEKSVTPISLKGNCFTETSRSLAQKKILTWRWVQMLPAEGGPLRRIFIWVCPWWSSIVTTQVSSKWHGLSHSGAATDRHPMLWAHATVWNGELVIRTMSSDE